MVLFGRNVNSNGTFAGAALEEERAAARIATLDHDGNICLPGGDHDFRHDDTGGDVGGYLDQHATTRSGGGNGESEGLLFTGAQHDGRRGYLEINGVDAEAARIEIGPRANDVQLVAATGVNSRDEKAKRAWRVGTWSK